MKKNRLFNFIIFIPFAIAVGAFIIYFRLLFSLKGAGKVTNLIGASILRYRKIGIFCLLIGIILLFIKTIFDHFRLDMSDEARDERVLDRISNKQINEEATYTFNENNIINDLLKGQTLIANFYNDKKTEKLVKFKNYNKDNNVIEFYDLTKDEKKTVIAEEKKVEYVKTENYDPKKFERCYKCNKVVAKDAVMCVHCGTMFEKVKKEETKTRSNPVVFIINLIIILLCIILFLLCFNTISKQSKINRGYLNINTIEKIK